MYERSSYAITFERKSDVTQRVNEDFDGDGEHQVRSENSLKTTASSKLTTVSREIIDIIERSAHASTLTTVSGKSTDLFTKDIFGLEPSITTNQNTDDKNKDGSGRVKGNQKSLWDATRNKGRRAKRSGMEIRNRWLSHFYTYNLCIGTGNPKKTERTIQKRKNKQPPKIDTFCSDESKVLEKAKTIYRKISGDGIDRSVVELWNGSNELTHKMIAELLKADERANQKCLESKQQAEPGASRGRVKKCVTFERQEETNLKQSIEIPLENKKIVIQFCVKK